MGGKPNCTATQGCVLYFKAGHFSGLCYNLAWTHPWVTMLSSCHCNPQALTTIGMYQLYNIKLNVLHRLGRLKIVKLAEMLKIFQNAAGYNVLLNSSNLSQYANTANFGFLSCERCKVCNTDNCFEKAVGKNNIF